MAKARLNLLIFLPLLILLCPSVKTGSPSRDPHSSKAADIKKVFLPTGKEIEEEKIQDVGGHIPAIYIVQAIYNRLAELEALKQWTKDTVTKMLNKQNESQQLVLSVFNNRQFRDQHLQEQHVKIEVALKWVNESQFTVDQMEKLGKLAEALTEAAKAKGYLKGVDQMINEYSTKVEELKEISEVALEDEQQQKENANEQTKMLKFVHQLREAHVNFLRQIRLEVELHYEFPKGLREFEQNAQNLEHCKTENKVQHGKDMEAASSSILQNKDVPKKEGQQQYEKASKAAFDRYYAAVQVNDALMNYNNVAKNMHIAIKTIIEMPLKYGENLVRSILDVAEMAADEEYEKNLKKIDRIVLLNAKNYLEKMFTMCDAVHSTFSKLPYKWQTEVHGHIHDKLEMPMGWYLRMQTKAYPHEDHNHNMHLTEEAEEEMVHIRVELLLAKTLLVYERLNKFYNIDYYYKIWKEGKMPEGTPMKSYFDEFEKQQKKLAPAASSTSHGQYD